MSDLTKDFTGADITELCQRAAKAAIRESINAEEERRRLAAENGDAEGHMQMLRSVLQLSIDYKDALHLFDMANRVN